MPNRTLCQVLTELREMHKTRNYSYMMGLLEEIQTMANRMEAALWDQHEIKDLREEIKKLEETLKKLKEEKEQLKNGKD